MLFISFFLFIFQNDTEKSASDPGTPPQTSKPSELKSTELKSTSKSSPRTSPETPKSPEVTQKSPEVTSFLFLLRSLSFASVLTSFLSVSRQLLQPTKHRRSKSRMVTWPRAGGGRPPLRLKGRFGVALRLLPCDSLAVVQRASWWTFNGV